MALTIILKSIILLPMNITGLENAISTAGGQNALARMIGIPQSSIWKWLHKSKKVPAEKVLLVEELTGVPRSELRPDIYPPKEYDRGSRDTQ